MKNYKAPVRWMLTWFDKRSETLAGELVLPGDEDRIRRALDVTSSTLLDGEWPVDVDHRGSIEELSGLKLDLEQFDYFVGAVRI